MGFVCVRARVRVRVKIILGHKCHLFIWINKRPKLSCLIGAAASCLIWGITHTTLPPQVCRVRYTVDCKLTLLVSHPPIQHIVVNSRPWWWQLPSCPFCSNCFICLFQKNWCLWSLDPAGRHQNESTHWLGLYMFYTRRNSTCVGLIFILSKEDAQKTGDVPAL